MFLCFLSSPSSSSSSSSSWTPSFTIWALPFWAGFYSSFFFGFFWGQVPPIICSYEGWCCWWDCGGSSFCSYCYSLNFHSFSALHHCFSYSYCSAASCAALASASSFSLFRFSFSAAAAAALSSSFGFSFFFFGFSSSWVGYCYAGAPSACPYATRIYYTASVVSTPIVAAW